MLWSLPGLPSANAFLTAAVLLVIPQLPLTFGNAVVAVTDVAHRLFGEQARTVTPRNVCRSAGIGNIAAAVIGGMPMCHGSSGLTAHHRLGARTAGMSLILGGALIAIGVVFGDQAPALLGQLPPVILAALLAYAGVRHAWLVAGLRGWRLATAVVAGAAGAATGNLLITMVVAMLVSAAVAGKSRLRPPRTSTDADAPAVSRSASP
jgi:SulP family sulfate permease